MRSYFELRNVAPDYYADYIIPGWLQAQLTAAGSTARVLDFGCGFGQLLGALRRQGWQQVEGADVEPAAIAHCRAQGYEVHQLGPDSAFYERNRGRFDVIVTQHVLEHIAKEEVVAVVTKLRDLLTSNGRLIVAVPNAQAFTGCYWAYEDFTHYTLYTSGSAYYVLRAAGFDDIRFVDIDCTAGLGLLKRTIKRAIWRLYDVYYRTACRLLANATHISSPNIYSYEVKVVALKTSSSR
jgi:SAM-dependent methyltransferase